MLWCLINSPSVSQHNLPVLPPSPPQVRDHAGSILCVRPSPHPDRLLTAAKDNSLRLWDFRQLGTVQVRGAGDCVTVNQVE